MSYQKDLIGRQFMDGEGEYSLKRRGDVGTFHAHGTILGRTAQGGQRERDFYLPVGAPKATFIHFQVDSSSESAVGYNLWGILEDVNYDTAVRYGRTGEYNWDVVGSRDDVGTTSNRYIYIRDMSLDLPIETRSWRLSGTNTIEGGRGTFAAGQTDTATQPPLVNYPTGAELSPSETRIFHWMPPFFWLRFRFRISTANRNAAIHLSVSCRY